MLARQFQFNIIISRCNRLPHLGTPESAKVVEASFSLALDPDRPQQRSERARTIVTELAERACLLHLFFECFFMSN